MIVKRGWCPTLYAPMPSGDGLLVRVKPPRARLTPGAARAVAAAAVRWGNGVVELTQRGNLQVRGLDACGTGPFAAAMVAAGLAEADPAREARRVVMAPPLLGDDPGMAADAEALTAAVEAAFMQGAGLGGLPGKFAVAVEAGGLLGGRSLAADLVAWSDGLARGVRLDGRRGMGSDEAAAVGFLPYPGAGFGAFGMAPAFGALDGAMLCAAADVAARLGTTLRVSPWRVLLLGRVPGDWVTGVAEVLGAAGWIVDPADARLRVTACVGKPGCGSGQVAARRDAAGLRPVGAVHVSGCAKGCAHPGVAATVLVGRDGCYDLVRNGRAGDTPARLGLTVQDALAAANEMLDVMGHG